MWYAIQTNSDDSWDYGSHDFSEAIEMLLADDIYQLIACIDQLSNYCVVELTRPEALALSETDFFGDLEE